MKDFITNNWLLLVNMVIGVAILVQWVVYWIKHAGDPVKRRDKVAKRDKKQAERLKARVEKIEKKYKAEVK